MKKFFVFSLLLLLLSACANEAWQPSPTFSADGVAMQGVENRLAFATEGITPITAGTTHKYIWHFWSDNDDYLEEFEVVAHYESNGKTVHVFSSQNTATAQPLNGADHHLQSLISLPDAGMWRIDVTFGTVLFDSVYVKVQ